MTDPRDELVEKVAQEIHEGLGGSGWGYSCYGGNEDHHLANELQSAAKAAIAVSLEEAAKVAEAKADEWATVWRDRMKADSHMEGKSDGADEIAAAIRAMIKES